MLEKLTPQLDYLFNTLSIVIQLSNVMDIAIFDTVTRCSCDFSCSLLQVCIHTVFSLFIQICIQLQSAEWRKKFQDSHLSKCCSQSQTVAVNAARTFTERCLLILGTCIFSCWDWPLEASVWAGCGLQQTSAGSHTGRWWTAAPRSHWRHSRAHPESWVYREKRCMWDAKVLTFIQTKQFPAEALYKSVTWEIVCRL